MSDDKCKRTEWSSIYNGCMPVASTYRVQGRSGAKSSQRLCAHTFETFWNAWSLGSHVSEVSRDSGVARVLQLGGSPESAQNRWRWCVAASWNAWYAPKALRQARLVRLRSRKFHGYSYQGQAPGRASCATGAVMPPRWTSPLSRASASTYYPTD